MRKTLVHRETPAVQPIVARMAGQKHTTMVLWVLACAPRVLALFETRRPDETRPRLALDAGKAWARGKIKMPAARRAILDCHHAATAVAPFDRAGEAAARAIAHAAATVHTQKHAIGLVLYGVTAFALASPNYPQDKDAVIAHECAWYLARLHHWAARADNEPGPWALFLTRKTGQP